MARIQESVDIKKPAERVYAYTTDASSWPKWQTIIPQSEQTSSGPVAVGTTFKGMSHMMGLSMKWTAKTTQYDPPGKFGKLITTAGMIVDQHDTFTPIEGGTRFTLTYDVKARNIFILFSPMMVSTMRKELKKSLGNLKGVLEAQS